MKRVLFSIVLSVFLVGCGSPRYLGTAIPDVSKKPEVVIVQDAETRPGFLDTMKNWLDRNNYTYSVVPDKSKHDLSKLTLEYEGHWGWDLALYLKNAEINAFKDGQRVGEVTFKVPYTANPSKFGVAETRINYMMDALFGKMTPEEATKAANSSKSSATK